MKKYLIIFSGVFGRKNIASSFSVMSTFTIQ